MCRTAGVWSLEYGVDVVDAAVVHAVAVEEEKAEAVLRLRGDRECMLGVRRRLAGLKGVDDDGKRDLMVERTVSGTLSCFGK